MATFNQLTLVGRLTADPDAPRTLPNSGTTVVKFRLAVGRSKKNQQTGQWENDPNPLYIDCETFDYADSKRKLGNVISQYVKKGDPIFVQGRLQFEQWDDKQSGQKRSKHKMVVDTVELLGSKNDNAGGGNSRQAGGHTPDERHDAPADNVAGGGDDGAIPF